MISVFNAVSVKLKELYPSGYEIYGDETVKQGLIEPCFYVSVIESAQEQINKKRLIREDKIDVIYFPLKQGDNANMQTVAENLMLGLRYVTANNIKYRAKNISSEIIDEVLHVFLTYMYTVTLTETGDKMSTLSIESEVK